MSGWNLCLGCWYCYSCIIFKYISLQNPLPYPKNVPAEYLETIKPNIAAIDMRLSDTYKNSPMVVVEDELVFIGNNSILFVNPETMTFREKQFIGARPNARLFSAVVVGRDIETFGGWDERRQQNDVNILDTSAHSTLFTFVTTLTHRYISFR